MSTKLVKFNNKDNPDFYRTLNKRVNQYFREKNKTRFGDSRMVFKTVCMVLLYAVPLSLMLTGVLQSAWGILSMWVLMGFGMSGVGMSVMHDANHGAYSKKGRINKLVGLIVNLIGGYHINWIIQHNVLHHSFTNVEGHDHDLDISVMRFSPDQPFNSKFKYQAYYAVFLYAALSLNWTTLKDFQQVNQFQKDKLLEGQGLSYASALTQIILYKALYYGFIMAMPIYLFPTMWLWYLVGFFVMHMIAGLILSLVFQPAHVVEETDFYAVDEETSIKSSWAVLQLRTTTNFAHRSRLFSWFIGGLNYQIEHHLFPTICHVHYRALSPIVKATAKEFGLPYYEYKTFYRAVKSHFSLLNQLGKGTHPYDLKREPVIAYAEG